MSLKWCKILYQVRIAAKVMFAVGGMYTSFYSSYQQLIVPQQIKKIIPAHGYFLLGKKWLQHNKKFSPATAWLVFTNVIYLL